MKLFFHVTKPRGRPAFARRESRAYLAMLRAAALVLLASARAEDVEEISCSKMKIKELRVFLADRGLRCDGCAEKADFVQMCEENKDAPLVKADEPPAASADKTKDQSIEDLLASMKGMPGVLSLPSWFLSLREHTAAAERVGP